jgi:hypothetical protein
MTRVLAPAPAKANAPVRRVSRPHDRDEREAERVADEVARGASVAGWSFASQPTAPPSIHRCAGPGRCNCPRCRAQAVQQQSGPGTGLDSAARLFMENAFGQDFGNVRLHADGKAAESARGMDARAYTVGEDIVSAEGKPNIAAAPSRRLLAHELAHVVQHRASGDRATVHRQAAGNAPAAPPAPAAPRPRPDREEKQNVGRGNAVDAELYRPAGWLTVKKKVIFNFVNTIKPWPSQEKKNSWRDTFISQVEKRWSFKHFLVPDATCAGEPQQVAVNVRVIPVTSNPHTVINVSYTDQFTQSRAGTRNASLDVLDVQESPGHPQFASEHEFGHMLGLPHVHCNRDDDECYGTNFEEKSDLMGRGSFVSPRDYEPFAELMPAFSGCAYKVQPASHIPTSRAPGIGGAIGFLLGGFGGGLGGALLGAALGPIGAVAGLVLGLAGGGLLGYLAGKKIGEQAATP